MSATEIQAPLGRRLTPDEFRDVIGHFASGVTVITTTTADGRRHGTTASAVSSLTLEPPMLLVCLNSQSGTGQAVAAAGAFAVNILGEDDGEIALRFATKGADKFAGVETQPARGDRPPLLSCALAHFECRVSEQVAAGTHIVFLAEVEGATGRAGAPLAYYRGRFGRLEMSADRAVYEAARARVLAHDLPAGARVDAATLAVELGAPAGAVHQALSRLLGEALLARGPMGGFVVRDASAPALDDVYAARRAIELGVADVTVGRVGADAIAELRRLMERTEPLVNGDRFEDVDRWVAANAAFHEHMVGLAGSASLVSAYRHLGLAGIDARALRAEDLADRALVWDHARLVEAYEAGDVELAREVIVRHADRRHMLRARVDGAAG